MGQYKHLSVEEREDIMVSRSHGKSISEIARRIGRSKSTVSREIRRNSFPVGPGPGACYRASTAQRKYGRRRLACVRPRKMDDPELASLVVRMIVDERWSPEQIAGRISLERPELSVSCATIYRAISARSLDPPGLAGTKRGIRSALRHRGKRRHAAGGPEERRGTIPGMRSISERPGEAEARTRLGDWEADTVVGKGAGPCLVTLVDRASGLLEGGRAESHTKTAVADVEIAALSRQRAVETVTPDRGKEFAEFGRVEAETGAVFYFALPHHPWQRGTNENTNGLLRAHFPKGTDFSGVSGKEVERVYDAINRRPRKRLGFRTPYEVHYAETLHLL